DTPTTRTTALSLHDALPIYAPGVRLSELNTEAARLFGSKLAALHQVSDGMTHEGLQRSYYLENVFDNTMESLSVVVPDRRIIERSEEHTSELQSRENLVCRL